MTIWNIPELRQRTEAASKLPEGDLPEGDLPEVGTVVVCDGLSWAVIWSYRITGAFAAAGAEDVAGNVGLVNSARKYSSKVCPLNWHYATPAEIDQFERDSALPDIVDPIEVEVEAVMPELINQNQWPDRSSVRLALNRGIEIERARKAGA